MLILGVDTSGKNGSIALVECEPSSSRTLDLVPLEGGTFSAQLVPQIAALLQKYCRTKYDIAVFAVVSGPGSFTGLRVGLAAVKALAEVLQKPIVAVSLLESIALASGLHGQVTAALDAGRGEIYAGTYDVRDGAATLISEQLLVIQELAQISGELATSDEKFAQLLRHGRHNVHLVSCQKAGSIASLAFQKFQRGETVSPESLDATYIRRSDAEIKFAGLTK